MSGSLGNGWKYYNHAAVPATATHIPVNTIPLNDGSIWHSEGAVSFP